MTPFRYRARDAHGIPQIGVVEALNWEVAREHLAALGLHSIEPGGPSDQNWIRLQQIQHLRENLDWKRLLRFLGGLLFGLTSIVALLYLTHRREIEVHGSYQVQGPRKPLRICFFVDGQPVYPTKRNSSITPTSYRCRLTFVTWRRPTTIFARLRMQGYSDTAHRPVPIKFGNPLELPPLTLHQQGDSKQNGKLPW